MITSVCIIIATIVTLVFVIEIIKPKWAWMKFHVLRSVFREPVMISYML